MFKKYARAISDPQERNSVFTIWLLRLVFLVVSILSIVVAFIVIMLESEIDVITGKNDMLIGLLTISFIIFGILSLVLHIYLRRKFLRILTRADGEEIPEISAYKKKVSAELAENKQKHGWALIVMVCCLVVSFALIVLDVALNPESEEVSSPYFYASTIIAIIGVLIYFYAKYFHRVKDLSEGKTIEQQTAEETKAIDEMQGREHRYRLEEDKNLQSFNYLFPTQRLREAVNAEQKKHSKITTICILVSIGVCFVAAILLFSGIFGEFIYRGFVYPVFMAVVMGTVFVATIPYAKRVNALEKEQVEILENTPEFEDNLKIYREYEQHAKIKAKILPILLVVSTVISLALAFISPTTMLSFSAIVLVIVGLYLNAVFVKALRLKVKPIEDKIDDKQKEQAELTQE